MNFVVYVWAFFLFNLVIVIHELGHFLTARAFGVNVIEFAIGMGPKFLKISKGGTLFSLRCIPIGGFCAMEGEEGKAGTASSFNSKELWKRVIVLVAGGFMNLVLGFVFAVIVSCARPIAEPTVAQFDSGSVSSETGLRVGDEIRSINGYRVYLGRDLSFALRLNESEEYTVEIMRDGIPITLKNVKFTTISGSDAKQHAVIDFRVNAAKKNLVNVLNYSALQIASLIKMTLLSIYGLITGKFTLKDMAGPVGMVAQVGELAMSGLKEGFNEALISMLLYMQMFTVSIGMFNLLPFPALDGGRIVFLAAEKIYGKPFKEGVEEIYHTIGFALLMLLMVAITYNDVIRIAGAWFRR
ncbi:MAG: site-2 protease family protein [Oscillospiraceae bacterium]|jgi:regulator of sigma E protease|nr:site-2 protease family protein [Oscillospiraceae bacterium]